MPRAVRLHLPRGYAAPDAEAALLPWSALVERLEAAANYWLATTRPDGRPHVAPLWGVWVEGALYFDGIPSARWARNIAANPSAAFHLESGTDVVVIEGEVEDLPSTDAALGERIVAAWNAKYGELAPEPATRGIFRLRPRRARAWTRFPHDATRFVFGP